MENIQKSELNEEIETELNTPSNKEGVTKSCILTFGYIFKDPKLAFTIV